MKANETGAPTKRSTVASDRLNDASHHILSVGLMCYNTQLAVVLDNEDRYGLQSRCSPTQ